MLGDTDIIGFMEVAYLQVSMLYLFSRSSVFSPTIRQSHHQLYFAFTLHFIRTIQQFPPLKLWGGALPSRQPISGLHLNSLWKVECVVALSRNKCQQREEKGKKAIENHLYGQSRQQSRPRRVPLPLLTRRPQSRQRNGLPAKIGEQFKSKAETTRGKSSFKSLLVTNCSSSCYLLLDSIYGYQPHSTCNFIHLQLILKNLIVIPQQLQNQNINQNSKQIAQS